MMPLLRSGPALLFVLLPLTLLSALPLPVEVVGADGTTASVTVDIP